MKFLVSLAQKNMTLFGRNNGRYFAVSQLISLETHLHKNHAHERETRALNNIHKQKASISAPNIQTQPSEAV